MLLDGYLGGEPDMKYTPSGKAVIDFSVAVGGGKDYPGRWYKVTFWEQDAELVNGLALKKGTALSVAGSLVEAAAWIGKEGQARGKAKLSWVDKLAYGSNGKMVPVKLPSAEEFARSAKGAGEGVPEIEPEDILF